jgi:acyl-CoA hydrolase
LKERAKSMINIAHPDDREMLAEAVFEMYNLSI